MILDSCSSGEVSRFWIMTFHFCGLSGSTSTSLRKLGRLIAFWIPNNKIICESQSSYEYLCHETTCKELSWTRELSATPRRIANNRQEFLHGPRGLKLRAPAWQYFRVGKCATELRKDFNVTLPVVQMFSSPLTTLSSVGSAQKCLLCEWKSSPCYPCHCTAVSPSLGMKGFLSQDA